MPILVRAASSFIPTKRRSLSKLASRFGIQAKALKVNWGITEVPCRSWFQNELSLAVSAARQLPAEITRGVKAIVFCSNTETKREAEHEIAPKLGLNVAICERIQMGCAGVVAAINRCRQLAFEHAATTEFLVCCGEVNRCRYSSPQSLRFLPMGDAGGAMVLSICEERDCHNQAQIDYCGETLSLPKAEMKADMLAIVREQYAGLLERSVREGVAISDLDGFLLTQSPEMNFRRLTNSILGSSAPKAPYLFEKWGHLGSVDHITPLETMLQGTTHRKLMMLANGETANTLTFASALVYL